MFLFISRQYYLYLIIDLLKGYTELYSSYARIDFIFKQWSDFIHKNIFKEKPTVNLKTVPLINQFWANLCCNFTKRNSN